MELFNVYSLYPVEPVRGLGSHVYDREGREYLDLYGGHAVISIGHAHPHYVKLLSEQVARLGFYSNSVENSPAEVGRRGGLNTRTRRTRHGRDMYLILQQTGCRQR